MSGTHILHLQAYKGKNLTQNEIVLQKFFEQRDEEHRRQAEKKQRKSSLLADDFFQVPCLTYLSPHLQPPPSPSLSPSTHTLALTHTHTRTHYQFTTSLTSLHSRTPVATPL
jgi:hypothetical protein